MSKISKELLEEIEAATVENRLTCSKAHEIADKLQLPLATVGQAADELKVKISKCQLGCF